MLRWPGSCPASRRVQDPEDLEGDNEAPPRHDLRGRKLRPLPSLRAPGVPLQRTAQDRSETAGQELPATGLSGGPAAHRDFAQTERTGQHDVFKTELTQVFTQNICGGSQRTAVCTAQLGPAPPSERERGTCPREHSLGSTWHHRREQSSSGGLGDSCVILQEAPRAHQGSQEEQATLGALADAGRLQGCPQPSVAQSKGRRGGRSRPRPPRASCTAAL